MDSLIASLITFGGIVLLDIVLSGDNAVVVGAKAATLPIAQRKKAIIFGMSVAVILRILLSLIATVLVTIPFLRTAGGLSLFYVAYGMYKDMTDDGELDGSIERPARSFGAALFAITLADLSMSIDNILAVAGAANGHWEALIFGLCLSIVIMGFAANMVASLIERHKWIGWVGLGLVVFVGIKLIYEDLGSFAHIF